MKITSLIIGGFKGIDSRANIPLAPVTLLFGANSMGKSTILQGFLYLYEVLVNRNLNPQFSSLTGEKVYLGGFENLVHGKGKSGTIKLGATLQFEDDDVWDDYTSAAEYHLFDTSIEYYPEAKSRQWSFELEIAWDRFQKTPYIKKYQCYGDQQFICRFEKKPGKPGSYISFYKPLSSWEIPDFAEPLSDLFGVELSQPIGLANQLHALPDINARISLDDVFWDWEEMFEDHPLACKTFFEASLSQAVLAPLQHLVKRLGDLLHIGPLRIIPDRGFSALNEYRKDRWYDGSGGWDEFINGGESARNRINDWWSGNLDHFNKPSGFNTPYSFHAVDNELNPLGQQYVYVTNNESGINHSLTELGIGVSQVFPFAVASCMNKNAIVSCEQPELHIHPAWQLVLGDMMLESVKNNPGKMFLVETHSEHLMLRLLKRRRDTAEEEGVPMQLACAKEDIQIIFCEQEVGKTRLLPIATTDEGEFDAPWPNGFFRERVQEV